jgi:hypothetical protein
MKRGFGIARETVERKNSAHPCSAEGATRQMRLPGLANSTPIVNVGVMDRPIEPSASG